MTWAQCPWSDPAGPDATSIRGSVICAFLLDADRWTELWCKNAHVHWATGLIWQDRIADTAVCLLLVGNWQDDKQLLHPTVTRCTN